MVGELGRQRVGTIVPYAGRPNRCAPAGKVMGLALRQKTESTVRDRARARARPDATRCRYLSRPRAMIIYSTEYTH